MRRDSLQLANKTCYLGVLKIVWIVMLVLCQILSRPSLLQVCPAVVVVQILPEHKSSCKVWIACAMCSSRLASLAQFAAAIGNQQLDNSQ